MKPAGPEKNAPEKSVPPTPAVRQRSQPISQLITAAKDSSGTPVTSTTSAYLQSQSTSERSSRIGPVVETTSGQPVVTHTERFVDSSGDVCTKTVFQITKIDRSPQQSVISDNQQTFKRTITRRQQTTGEVSAVLNTVQRSAVASKAEVGPSPRAITMQQTQSTVTTSVSDKSRSDDTRKVTTADTIYATPTNHPTKAQRTPVASPVPPTSKSDQKVASSPAPTKPNIAAAPSDSVAASAERTLNRDMSRNPSQSGEKMSTDKVAPYVLRKDDKPDSSSTTEASSNVTSPTKISTKSATQKDSPNAEIKPIGIVVQKTISENKLTTSKPGEPGVTRYSPDVEPDITAEATSFAPNSDDPSNLDDMKFTADMIKLPIIDRSKNGSNYKTIENLDESYNGNGKNYSLQLPTDLNPPSRPYPKKVFFIIGNEFCERFNYYGLRTILVLYFRQVLGLSDADSTVFYHLFAALSFLTPILGAILADTLWGKYKTILNLSILYLVGENILLLGSIYWDSKAFCCACTAIGLFLIGVGTGGIKPCVNALGADQFYESEIGRRQAFFSMFYGAINGGSVFSSFLTPLFRSQFHCVDRNDCYPLAFGVPTILMFISIIVIVAARDKYYLAPLPEKNALTAFCQCVWLAIKRKLSGQKPSSFSLATKTSPNQPGNASSSSLDVSSSGADETAPVVEGGNEAGGKLAASQLSLGHDDAYQRGDIGNFKTASDDRLLGDKEEHWLYLAKDSFDTKTIEDYRSVLRAIILMLPLPIYWTLYDQQGSMWTLQATRMNGHVFGSADFVVEPDQLSFINSGLVIIMIPIFQYVIYPLFAKFGMLTSPISRITIGGLLAALAFVLCACVELGIQNRLTLMQPNSGDASLLVLNGLGGCTMNNSAISNVQNLTNLPPNDTLKTWHLQRTKRSIFEPSQSIIESLIWKPFGQLAPLTSKYLTIPSSTEPYHLKFNLASPAKKQNQASPGACQFDPTVEHRLSLEPLPGGAVRLLYLEQGNGRIAYKMFEETVTLPGPGKARVRLFYAAFGSTKEAAKRRFYLVPSSPKHKIKPASRVIEHHKPMYLPSSDGRQSQIKPIANIGGRTSNGNGPFNLPESIDSHEHGSNEFNRRLGEIDTNPTAEIYTNKVKQQLIDPASKPHLTRPILREIDNIQREQDSSARQPGSIPMIDVSPKHQSSMINIPDHPDDSPANIDGRTPVRHTSSQYKAFTPTQYPQGAKQVHSERQPDNFQPRLSLPSARRMDNDQGENYGDIIRAIDKQTHQGLDLEPRQHVIAEPSLKVHMHQTKVGVQPKRHQHMNDVPDDRTKLQDNLSLGEIRSKLLPALIPSQPTESGSVLHMNTLLTSRKQGHNQESNKSNDFTFMPRLHHDLTQNSSEDHTEDKFQISQRTGGRSLDEQVLIGQPNEAPHLLSKEHLYIQPQASPHPPHLSVNYTQPENLIISNQFTQRPIHLDEKDRSVNHHMAPFSSQQESDGSPSSERGPLLIAGDTSGYMKSGKQTKYSPILSVKPHSMTGVSSSGLPTINSLNSQSIQNKTSQNDFINGVPRSIFDEGEQQNVYTSMRHIPIETNNHPAFDETNLQTSDMFTRSLAKEEPGYQALIKHEYPSDKLNNIEPIPLEFKPLERNGQVFVSDYLDVDVPPQGLTMRLVSNDSTPLNISPHEEGQEIYLKPGTRNLLTLNQVNATDAEVNHEILQDNDYQINMLYQVPAIIVITASEIMFYITATELSYAMAPDSMKSIVMALNCLTIGIGNLLTVFIQSLHPFSSLVGNFFFYSILMIADMIVFAVIGFYHYKPRTTYVEISS